MRVSSVLVDHCVFLGHVHWLAIASCGSQLSMLWQKLSSYKSGTPML